MTSHDHPQEGDCQLSCPAWAEGALELAALLRRPEAMLAACQAAERIEWVVVTPATAGVVLPEFLAGEELVRLNLVVGRDCPEVLLDAWGLRVNLTFRGRRHDCAVPWAAVKRGLLGRPPQKKVRRFGVVEGGAAGEPAPAATPTPASTSTPVPAPTSTPGPAATPARPRPVFGVIPGGRSDRKD
ncbi:MAG: hypothetical protein NDI82_08760 [Anaeromyxobacteraceae bacterium]|nr:hypothetical protein [Anaeromyxobacteraceae bacterium]